MTSQYLWPKWVQVIEHKLKIHIDCLMSKHFIQSSNHQIISPDEVFNETIIRMIQIEQKGDKIQTPLAYSKKVAGTYIIEVKKKYFNRKDEEFLKNLDYNLKIKRSSNQNFSYDEDLVCQILGDFRSEYPKDYNLIKMRDFEELEYSKIALSIYKIDDERSRAAARKAYSRAKENLFSFSKRFI